MLEDSDIIATMKSKRISWAEHVWRGREQTLSVKSSVEAKE